MRPKLGVSKSGKTLSIENDLWKWYTEEYCPKERVLPNEGINAFLKKLKKEHGDGNPQFTIDQFEDPNFIATPAFYRDGTTWEVYLKQADSAELNSIRDQIIMIDKKLGRYI